MDSTIEEEDVAGPFCPGQLSGNNNVLYDCVDCTFEEIIPPSGTDGRPHMVEALYIHVEPKQCNCVLKELSSILPMEEDLVHLKRVRKGPSKSTSPSSETAESSNKRPKLVLQVLLGSRRHLEQFLSETNIFSTQDLSSSSKIHPLIEKYGPVHSVMVPGRPPQSNDEWKEWNNTIWPVQFLPLKTEEYQRQQAAPPPDELSTMKRRIEESISQSIVLVVDPTDDEIVSICRIEREQQQRQQQPLHETSSLQHHKLVLDNNPLATPILLAIQGVSRREREATLGFVSPGVNQLARGGVNVSSNGRDDADNISTIKMTQYLCTGYDMYCYYEPNIFEAMACLHARLRRLVYFRQNPYASGEGGGEVDHEVSPATVSTMNVFPNACSKHYIHNLQGTNHRYRAFEYHRSDAVGVTCKP